MDSSQNKITITAADGFILHGYELMPVHQEVTATIQFNAATAVKKEFYLKLGHYLAGLGYRVVLYDYRGIGASRPASLKGCKASMLDWALLDMDAVTTYLLQQYPQQPLIWVGHSIGGQMAGWIRQRHRIAGVIAVNTSTGYWKTFRFPYNMVSWFLWYIFLPVTTRLFGYAPISKYGLGEDLPTGVARQWAQWCTSSHHFAADLEKHTGSGRFNGFTAPIHFITSSDDYIATEPNIQHLASFYPKAPITITSITPQQAGVKKIGHVGLFRKNMQPTVWPLIAGLCDGLATGTKKPATAPVLHPIFAT